MTDVDLIIDTILPGDLKLGLPSAKQIEFGIYLKKYNAESILLEFTSILDDICLDKYKFQFEYMSQLQRLEVINDCKIMNVRIFSLMLTHLFNAYYTTPAVLEKIGAGSVPPFPLGNNIDKDDWTILEPVFERGQIYRNLSRV